MPVFNPLISLPKRDQGAFRDEAGCLYNLPFAFSSIYSAILQNFIVNVQRERLPVPAPSWAKAAKGTQPGITTKPRYSRHREGFRPYPRRLGQPE